MSDTPPLDRLAGCEMMLTQDGTLKVTLLMKRSGGGPRLGLLPARLAPFQSQA
jgi:hypothetical protein